MNFSLALPIGDAMVWSLPKLDSFLPDVNLKQLQKLYSAEQKTKPKLRLLCAIRRKEGESIDCIASGLRMPRRTVHETLCRFVERGIAGKDSIRQTGRPAHLTLKQRKDFAKRLIRGPPNNASGLWTTKEVRQLIKDRYDVEYNKCYVWELLRAGGFSLQKPRNRNYRAASQEEQDRFKKKLPGWRAIIAAKDL